MNLTDADYVRAVCPHLPVDAGIVRAVRVLREAGVETFESCEGGVGHAYPEPTVRLHGGGAAGWPGLRHRAGRGAPVLDLRRVWPIVDGEPTGPWWELTFRPSPTTSSCG
jgi:hypothetical protein